MARFLDAFRSKRVWLLVALGFASGLPLLLTGQTLGAWMTNRGVSLKTIGVFSLVRKPMGCPIAQLRFPHESANKPRFG